MVNLVVAPGQRGRGLGQLRVVTGDAALEPLLREAGARAVLRTLAMRGPLPIP